MSAERTIANYLRIAREDLAGAMLLAAAGNRNAAYLAEQAAEKVIRAVLTSEGVHAGVRHDLRDMVAQVPEANPLRGLLVATVPLAAYATTYRYPTSTRVPPSPPIAPSSSTSPQYGPHSTPPWHRSRWTSNDRTPSRRSPAPSADLPHFDGLMTT